MWINANFLKVNEDKTVALVHASRKNQMKHNITAIKIGDCDITPIPSARNIGVVFDAEMSMACHVHQTCRVCYYHLKNVASIRSCLTEQAAICLVHSLVVSRLDYGNALSVRYSRRSHRQTTESAELCSPIGCSLWQTRPHHSCAKEASLASGVAASDLQNSATNVPRSERARTYLHRRHVSPAPTSASVTISQQQWPPSAINE